MNNLVTIDGPNRAIAQLGKAPQQIFALELTAALKKKLLRTLAEQITAPFGMEDGEEGGTLEIRIEELLLLLDEVPAAPAVTEHAQTAQAEKLLVTDDRTVELSAGVVFENVDQRLQEAITKAGVALKIQ